MRTKTVDKACRDYESKFLKAETEARKAAKVGQFRHHILPDSEIGICVPNHFFLPSVDSRGVMGSTGVLNEMRVARVMLFFISNVQMFEECYI